MNILRWQSVHPIRKVGIGTLDGSTQADAYLWAVNSPPMKERHQSVLTGIRNCVDSYYVDWL